MSDKPRIRVVTGSQSVNGVQTDCVLDHDDKRVIIADDGDPRRLANTAFEAGREWERSHPTVDMGELPIDGRVGFNPYDPSDE